MTLTDLQTKRDQVISQLASLTRRLQAGDKAIEYDLAQANKALSLLDTEIAKAQGDTNGYYGRFYTGEGL